MYIFFNDEIDAVWGYVTWFDFCVTFDWAIKKNLRRSPTVWQCTWLHQLVFYSAMLQENSTLYLLLLHLLPSQCNPAKTNLFLKWLLGISDYQSSFLILRSWGFTIFCKILLMKTIIEFLQWCKSSDIALHIHANLCAKNMKRIL